MVENIFQRAWEPSVKASALIEEDFYRPESLTGYQLVLCIDYIEEEDFTADRKPPSA